MMTKNVTRRSFLRTVLPAVPMLTRVPPMIPHQRIVVVLDGRPIAPVLVRRVPR